MMTPVKYDEHDGMPVEVATEMLCAPRAKLTNRMRKTCWAARWKTITSPTPVQYSIYSQGLGKPLKTSPLVTDETQRKPLSGEKAKRRFSKLLLAPLLTAYKHAIRDRLAVQRPFMTAEQALNGMQAETSPDVITQNAARYQATIALLRVLEANALRLDTIIEAAEEELQKRGCRLALPGAPLNN